MVRHINNVFYYITCILENKQVHECVEKLQNALKKRCDLEGNRHQWFSKPLKKILFKKRITDYKNRFLP